MNSPFAALTNPQIVVLFNKYAVADVKRFATRERGVARLEATLASAQVSAREALGYLNMQHPADAEFEARGYEQDDEHVSAFRADEMVRRTVVTRGGAVVDAPTDFAPTDFHAVADRLDLDARASLAAVTFEADRADPPLTGAFVASLADARARQTARRLASEAVVAAKPRSVEARVAARAASAAEPRPAPAKRPRGDASTAGLSGKKAALLALMLRDGGVSEREGCEALGWAACGATISRVVAAAAAAGFSASKLKVDGVTRYALTAPAATAAA